MNAFILSLFSKEDKLKPSTLYQILIGKRTSSVLTYAFFHDLLHLSAAFPQLSEEKFDARLQTLIKAGKLEETEDGLLLVAAQREGTTLPDFKEVDFFRFGRKETECWRLVQFLVQAVSYLDKAQQYVPLESSPFYIERVRLFIHQYREELSTSLFEELTVLFSNLGQDKADFLANTLTGDQQNGSAFFQLLPEASRKEPYVTLAIASATHSFFRELLQHKHFLLYHFLRPILLQNVNHSMLQTRKLFQQGYTFEQVKQRRRLKQGTIQDHIIEWALLDEDFPFDLFLPDSTQWSELPKDSWKYSYKTLVSSYDLSFLEIRLCQIWKRREAC